MGRKEKGQPVMKKYDQPDFRGFGSSKIETYHWGIPGRGGDSQKETGGNRIKVPQPTNWKQTSTNNHQVVLLGITTTGSVHMEDSKNTTTPYFRVRLCFG